jgi:hypothetical protein
MIKRIIQKICFQTYLILLGYDLFVGSHRRDLDNENRRHFSNLS